MDLFIVLLVIIGALALFSLFCFALLIVTYVMTPAATFLKAKIKKQPIILTATSSGQGAFEIGEKSETGTVEVQHLGYFKLTERSGIRERKSGNMLYFGSTEFAATIPLEFGLSVAKVEEKGIEFFNSDEFKKQVTSEQHGKKEIKIFGKTFRMHELSHLFPFNIKPVYIEGVVENERLKFSKLNNIKPQTVLLVFICLIIAAIIVVIVRQATGGSVASTCNFNLDPGTISAMCKNAGYLVNATAQQIANTPPKVLIG